MAPASKSLKAQRLDPPSVIFHVDMDAFFASVEQLEHPEWRGRPVIVGGAHSARGVVSSASYEARVFGVRSAMPMYQAREKCPRAVFTEGRHEVYRDYSRRLMDVLDDFSPVVEQISVDEAFLDMSGTAALFGPPAEAARRLKNAIVERLGLTASVGVAPNKFVAKIASDLHKPDGLTVVEPAEVLDFLEPLPVERLMGVGKRTAPLLHRLGLTSIGQVRQRDRAFLEAALGETLGSHIDALARGEDGRELESDAREKSISHEVTFERDNGDGEFLASVLLDLCDRVARRARKYGLSGRTVSLVWRDPDFSRHSRSHTWPEGVQDSRLLFGAVDSMLAGLRAGTRASRRRFRLLGVRLSGFGEGGEQLSLFASTRAAALDKAADAVRDRFGEDAIQRGRVLGGREATERAEGGKGRK